MIDWNEKGKAKEWRNAIAEVINATNEKAGIAERVDPRSYKDRGIPLIPTIHLGKEQVHWNERASDRKGQYQSCNREIQCHDNEDLWIYL